MLTLVAMSGGVICSSSGPQSWTGSGIGRQAALTAAFKLIEM